jgi:hypothetical protein
MRTLELDYFGFIAQSNPVYFVGMMINLMKQASD